MQIQVNAADRETRHVDDEWVQKEVEKAMGRFADRITRVEVHIRDVNGPKVGTDKQCAMEARLAGLDPMAVTADGENIGAAVISAAGKLHRKVQSELEKRDQRR